MSPVLGPTFGCRLPSGLLPAALALLLASACVGSGRGIDSGGDGPVLGLAPSSQSVLAGDIGGAGFQDGPDAQAGFNTPRGLVVTADGGSLFVADSANGCVRVRSDSLGAWTTLPAKLRGTPYLLAMDGAGALYVGERQKQPASVFTSYFIEKMAQDGTGVTLLASWTNDKRTNPSSMDDLAVDLPGNPYVLSSASRIIYQIRDQGADPWLGDPKLDERVKIPIRGYWPRAMAFWNQGRTQLLAADGSSASITFRLANVPTTSVATWDAVPPIPSQAFGPDSRFEAMAVDLAGDVFFSVRSNSIWELVVPVAGSVPTSVRRVAGTVGRPGSQDGDSLADARFGVSLALAAAAPAFIYVSDTGNNQIRRYEGSSATVSTLGGLALPAGSGNGPDAEATFAWPGALAADASGRLLVADVGDGMIRQVVEGVTGTLAGSGQPGQQDGPAAEAGFGLLQDLAVSADGSTAYVLDGAEVRAISGGSVSTLALLGPIAGGGPVAAGPGLIAAIEPPRAMALDAPGNRLLIAAADRIQALALDTLLVTPLLSLEGGDFGGVAVGPDGTVYWTDRTRGTVELLDPSGVLGTLAGPGGGPALVPAALNGPTALVVGLHGEIYVADTGDNQVQVLYQPPGTSAWQIAQVAPSAPSPLAAVPAGEIVQPQGLALLPDGDLAVSTGCGILRITDPLAGILAP